MHPPDGSAQSFDNHIGWVACNLEYAPAQWNAVRQRAASMGIRCIPWIRLCHVHLGEDFETIKQRLALLTQTAINWGENLILPNYEDEAATYAPADVANHLYNVLDWDGDTGWSSLAWLLNDVDYRPINHDPMLLQIFPTDNRWPFDKSVIEAKMGDCVHHARVDKGFDYVGVTYQTYSGATPAIYDCQSYMHSVFSGNHIGHGQWGDWFA